MKYSPKKQLRCAVYTRKSTDHNLELEFNSLDAQREACEAYIKSQAHEGWRLISDKYDDGGHSGASLERPALQELLNDVRAGKIDVIVVYKIDRLTRSLTDFAKLVEVFDQQSVSFVSITQSFNTTTSMGRLTLNVLLSFAQFEREVIGERVRDKIAASKKKGMWVGGPVPLGYRAANKKLSIVPEEAKTVRMIFQRFLALKSIGALLTELDQKGLRTRKQKLSSGRVRGGCRYGKGTLHHLLKNRFYIGEVAYRGSNNKGEHDPIIERSVFETVQKLLSKNAVERKAKHQSSGSLLTGLLFDDRGNRMTPTYTRKHGVRYRYYISHTLLQSRKDESGTVRRVPATEIEETIVNALRLKRFFTQQEARPTPKSLQAIVQRVILRDTEIEIVLAERLAGSKGALSVPWRKRSVSANKGILHDSNTSSSRLSQEMRDTLLTAIAHARRWMNGIESGSIITISKIAAQEGYVERHIRLLLPLAFTPPALISAVVNGTILDDVTVTSLAKRVSLAWKKSK